MSSDGGDVVEGSQHRKRKLVRLVLCSEDEDSPGTCPDAGEDSTLPSRKRKVGIRKSARLMHKISGNGGAPGRDFDNDEEIQRNL